MDARFMKIALLCVAVVMLLGAALGSRAPGGIGKPAVDRDNQLLPAGEAPRPQPAAPSIFE